MRKQILNFGGYEVDTNGNVWSCFKSAGNILGKRKSNEWHKLTPSHETQGRLFVVLYRDGKRYTKLVHRLLATSFILNSDKKPQVNHKDGNYLNNKLSNLYWGTQSDNAKDAIRHGTFSKLKQNRC